jgi:hypothetical protein
MLASVIYHSENPSPLVVPVQHPETLNVPLGKLLHTNAGVCVAGIKEQAPPNTIVQFPALVAGGVNVTVAVPQTVTRLPNHAEPFQSIVHVPWKQLWQGPGPGKPKIKT